MQMYRADTFRIENQMYHPMMLLVHGTSRALK